MSRAINESAFSIGDTLIVNWGLNGTGEPATDTLTNRFLTNIYELIDAQVISGEGTNLQYQYQLIKRGAPEREIFFDFFLFYYKTEWCPYNFSKHDKDICVYAHNYQDFRRKNSQQLFPKMCKQWNFKKKIENYL